MSIKYFDIELYITVYNYIISNINAIYIYNKKTIINKINNFLKLTGNKSKPHMSIYKYKHNSNKMEIITSISKMVLFIVKQQHSIPPAL